MKILLHICCAPCSIYPINILKKEGFSVLGFFYRHNIHPYTECLKRENALKAYAKSINLKIIYQEKYDLDHFLYKVIYRKSDRCFSCYYDRILSSAVLAKKKKLIVSLLHYYIANFKITN